MQPYPFESPWSGTSLPHRQGPVLSPDYNSLNQEVLFQQTHLGATTNRASHGNVEGVFRAHATVQPRNDDDVNWAQMLPTQAIPTTRPAFQNLDMSDPNAQRIRRLQQGASTSSIVHFSNIVDSDTEAKYEELLNKAALTQTALKASSSTQQLDTNRIVSDAAYNAAATDVFRDPRWMSAMRGRRGALSSGGSSSNRGTSSSSTASTNSNSTTSTYSYSSISGGLDPSQNQQQQPQQQQQQQPPPQPPHSQ